MLHTQLSTKHRHNKFQLNWLNFSQDIEPSMYTPSITGHFLEVLEQKNY